MAREIKPYEELELKDDFMFGLIMHDSKYVKPFFIMAQLSRQKSEIFIMN